jgi:hypothetical protein
MSSLLSYDNHHYSPPDIITAIYHCSQPPSTLTPRLPTRDPQDELEQRYARSATSAMPITATARVVPRAAAGAAIGKATGAALGKATGEATGAGAGAGKATGAAGGAAAAGSAAGAAEGEGGGALPRGNRFYGHILGPTGTATVDWGGQSF